MLRSDCVRNLAAVSLFDSLHETSDREALRFRDRSFTYGDVARYADAYAGLVREYGAGDGSRVGLVLPDSIAFVGAFFGILASGATAVPISVGSSFEDIRSIVRSTEIGLLIAAEAGVLGNLGIPLFIAGLEEEPRSVRPAAERRDDVDADAIAYILFSSGSTGAPRGIPHRHGDLVACAQTFAADVVAYEKDDVSLCVPKLPFGYALGCNLIFPFLAGSTAILLEGPPFDDVLVSAIVSYDPTLLFLQPRNVSAVLRAVSRCGCRRLRLAVVAGEKLGDHLWERWNEALPNVPLLDGFGTTEMNAIFISNTVGAARRGSVGKPIRGFDVEIRRPDGSRANAGEVGELWAAGPSSAREYWRDAKATAERIVGDWHRTGDLFSCDDDGFYFLRGRVDNMIKVGCGRWIAPEEIETPIGALGEVSECAIVGWPDAHGVNALKAYVRTADGIRPSRTLRERVMHAVSSETAGDPDVQLVEVEFVTDFPRTNTGKLDRQRLESFAPSDFGYNC